MIRVPQVRVVDDEGLQLGVMPTQEALRVAQERGYDLVEVAPLAAPPVARFLDYGQFKYDQARRERDARRHQRQVEFKEIRLSPKIGTGDFDTKVRRAIQFLEAGDRIKVSCRFRGRELTHAYLGRDLLMRFADLVKDHGIVERQPLLEGKSMSIVITSTHKVRSTQPTAAADNHGATPVVEAVKAATVEPPVEPAGEAVPEPAAAEAPPVVAKPAAPKAAAPKAAAPKAAAPKPVAKPATAAAKPANGPASAGPAEKTPAAPAARSASRAAAAKSAAPAIQPAGER